MKSPEEALELAQIAIDNGDGEAEWDEFGCLTVYDDGGVSFSTFAIDELCPEDKDETQE